MTVCDSSVVISPDRGQELLSLVCTEPYRVFGPVPPQPVGGYWSRPWSAIWGDGHEV